MTPKNEPVIHADEASGCVHVNKLVLAGGGPWTIAYIGAIQYLEHTGMLQSINTFVGCSAGALIGFLVCLGLTAADVRRFLTDKFRKDGCHRLDIEQALSLVQRLGLDDGRKIHKVLQDALNLYANRPDVDFVDFAKLTGKDLIVCVSNLTDNKHEFMCMSRTPNMSVLKALRMSISLPLIFTPVTCNGTLYVDGGIFNNYPADYCLRKEAALVDTLGFNLQFCSDHDSETHEGDADECNPGFMQYVWRLTTAVISRSNDISHTVAAGRDGLDAEFVINDNVFTINFDPQACIITAMENAEEEEKSTSEPGVMNFSMTDLEFSLTDPYIDKCIRYGYCHTKKCITAVCGGARQM